MQQFITPAGKWWLLVGATLALCIGCSMGLPQAPLGGPSFVDIPTVSCRPILAITKTNQNWATLNSLRSSLKLLGVLDPTKQEQVVEYMGYMTETHDVDSNGYLLRLTRMINPLVQNHSQVERSILFSHGLLQDSVSQFLSFAAYVHPEAPTKDSYGTNLYENEDSHLDKFNQATNATYSRMCLPCLFSNNNYDVWLLEQRGSSRGSSQVADSRLEDPNRYWNFTNDDQALEDLPNVIDYILNVTERGKLSFVGISKGTLHMNMLLSAKPDYADKIEAYVALAPIAYLGRILGVGYAACFLEPLIRNIDAPYGTYDVLVGLDSLLVTLFGDPLLRTTLYRAIISQMTGPDKDLNILTKALLGHTLEPNSFKVFAHFAQLVLTNKFQKFDYGSEEKNWIAYGQSEPPQYNPGNIRLKGIIMVRSTGNDWQSRPQDQEQFISALKVPLLKDIVTPPEFNHLSYVLAKDAFTYVFKPVLNAVNEAYLTQSD